MNYTSVNGTFTYTITNNSSYVFDSTDYAIIQSAFDRWDNVVTLDARLEAGYTIRISYSVDVLEVGILGGASLQTVWYFNTVTFGNTFPYEADITLNASYLSGMKNAVRNDGKTSYYYVLLHEIGHILGIGSLWDLPGTPKVSYLDNGVTKYYYTGANALREYKSYFTAMGSSSFVGVPIEDNGGAGTVNVHPEEGPEGGVSADNRYINGILHPGLDTELMTGWLDGAPVSTPLSRITLGFLQDMGYTVNYNLADIYNMAAGSGTSSIDWASPTETILRASNLEAGDNFGQSVAISGNYAIVTATLEDGSSTDAGFNCGAAYIFERDGSGNWIQNPIILRASNLGAGDRFGQCVAISGNYAIVGATYEDGSSDATAESGAAYIFERDGSGNWAEKTILRASNLEVNDNFGISVAISGNYVIVGALGEDGSSNATPNSGAAYIFERDGSGNWAEKNILQASNLEANDRFGQSVAISGNYAIVGAWQEDGSSNATLNSGAAYMFERDGNGNWAEKQILRASNLGANDFFGISVAISGNYAIVGAYFEDGSSTDVDFNSGAAYIFERDGSGNWAEKNILRASNLEVSDRFGQSVAISGNYAIVGAYLEDGSSNTRPNSGAAYMFERDGSGNWAEKNILRASNLEANDNFGYSAVAISGNYAIVGAWQEDGSSNATPNSGAAYIYTGVIPPPTMTITATASGSPLATGSTTKNTPINLTFTASEAITGFQEVDISFNRGSLTNFAASSATVYTATFTPTIQGAYTINVPVGAFTANGLNNTAASTFTFNFDAAPTMAITSTTLASGATSNIASIPLTFTASETITDFAVEDITFNKGSLTGFAGIGTEGSVYTATFTQGGQGEHIINVPVGVYIDASGNANTAASSFNWTYDSVQPNMDISSTTFGVTSGSTTNNSTIALTFTSSKPTNNFLVGDISFNRGTLTDLSGIGTEGTVYTATFTPNGQGAHTIYVPVDAYIDSAGNNNTASNIFTWSYDSNSPTMDISSTTLGVTRGSTTKTTPIDLLFTSSEATTNFALEDISVANGTLSNFVRISDTVYTARFAPTSPGPVACTIDVAAGAYTDAATNLNNLATQFAFTFDSVVPTMTITSSAGVTSGSTIDNPTIALTFTSSKATNNFVVGDISVTNGTLSAFASSSPTVYTATFTPTRQGLCTIGVASSVYTDSAGNNNAAANTFSVSYIPKFAAFNDANNLEQTYITGFLDVSGTINHRTGDLNVMDGNLIVSSGNVSLNNGNLYVGGNGVLNSNLAVSESTTLGRLSVSNNMDVSGASALNSALAISGLTSFNNNVSVSSNKTFTVGTGTTAMGGSATMNSTLTVAGAVSMNSGLRVAGATTLTNAIMDGPVSVSGRVVLLNDISFTGPNIDICGNLRAQYPANSIPAAAIIGGISVVNLFNNDVSLSQTLSVGGATSLSTLAATGNATLRSTVGIVGATTMSALTTGGATTFGGALRVTGKAALTNDISFNGSRIDICGNLYANYPANSIPSSAVVGGGINPIFMTDVSVNAMLSVAGATTLKSTLVVSGKTALTNNVSFDISYSRIDICGNLYANYQANSIPSAAIIGGTDVSSVFITDVSMNSRLYVKDSIKIGNLATVQLAIPVWYQDGTTINAENTDGGGNLTHSVSLSADGSVVAFGCTGNDGTTVNTSDNRGSVRVYQRDATNTTIAPIGWKKLGDDIDGEAALDESGKSVSLVKDGTNIFVAIGANKNTASGAQAGHVRVYKYEEGKAAQTNQGSPLFGPLGWKRLGADIDAEAALDWFGASVSLSSSSNGLIVAIGGRNNDGIGSNAGHARVYTYNDPNWTKLGDDIDGEAAGDGFGGSVSLSADGSIVAIGARYNAGNGANSGSVRVYQRDATNNSIAPIGWKKLGGDIDGEAASDQSGFSLSLVSDGTNIIVAIAAEVNSPNGHVRVYQYVEGKAADTNQTNPTFGPLGWKRLGGDIDGESATTAVEQYSVSLAANWPNVIVAIGVGSNDGTVANSDRGHVRVYKYNANKTAAVTDQSLSTFGPVGWNRIGQDIDGTTGDQSGAIVSLSANGSTLAVIGNSSYYAVRVYKVTDPQLSTSVLSTSGLQTAGTATISGPLAVTGATTLSSTLTTSGAATMTSLNVAGAPTLAAMTVTGNATIGGTLLIAGTTSIGVSTMNSTLSVGAATTMNTKLVVNSDVSLNNRLTVGGATTMNSTLTLAGATTLNNTAFMTSLVTTGATTLASTLYVAKSVTFNGDLDTSGVLLQAAVTMPSTLTVAGAATLSPVLSVAGATTARSTLNASGAVTIGGILSIAGVTTMSGASTMNGKVSVGGDVSMNSTLIVTNNATLASTLAVVGLTTLSSTLYTSGSTTINSTLNVTGKTTFFNDVSFNNNVTIPNTLTVNNNRITIGSSNIQFNAGISVDSAIIPTAIYTTNNATVGGVLTVVGSTTLSSTLTVGGATTAGTMYASSNATLGSTLSVAGGATVGPLTVSGATTVSTLTTTGATTVGGTLGITGASTMTTLNVYGPMRQW